MKVILILTILAVSLIFAEEAGKEVEDKGKEVADKKAEKKVTTKEVKEEEKSAEPKAEEKADEKEGKESKSADKEDKKPTSDAESSTDESNVRLPSVFLPWNRRLRIYDLKRYGRLQCRVPSFVDRLPEKEREAIKKIWKDYKKDDCKKQIEETAKIIDELPVNVRMRALSVLPKFLIGIDEKTADRFRAIIYNQSLSMNKKDKAFRMLADKVLTGNRKKQYLLATKIGDGIKEWRKNKVNSLSPAAKEVFTKIEKLRTEFHNILWGTSHKVLRELSWYRP